MDVRLPKIGESADGVVVSLLVKPGDVIQAGQTVLELENEKAIAPVPSPVGGKVSAVRVKEGEKISVGSVIFTVEGGEGAGGSAPAASPAAKPAAAVGAKAPRRVAAPVVEDLDEDDVEIEVEAGEDGPIPAASPYVRKVARELGIRLSRVRGSESGGRVVIADLARYVARLERGVARAGRYAEEPKGLVFQPVSVDFAQWGPVVTEPLSGLRKVIASRMVENSVSLPHVTQFDEVDLTGITSLREKYKGEYERAGVRLTPTPFLIQALVGVLKKHPRFNASLDEVQEKLVLKQYYHIGIAVDTDAGLLVPVIRDADRKSLVEVARELGAIAEKARERKIGPDEMKGGTFTISNQGAIGSGHFTPIINKPESAILGVGKASMKPVVVAGGKIEARLMMPVTLSYDHRIIDGGSAARFMSDLVQALQGFPETGVKL